MFFLLVKVCKRKCTVPYGPDKEWVIESKFALYTRPKWMVSWTANECACGQPRNKSGQQCRLYRNWPKRLIRCTAKVISEAGNRQTLVCHWHYQWLTKACARAQWLFSGMHLISTHLTDHWKQMQPRADEGTKWANLFITRDEKRKK